VKAAEALDRDDLAPAESRDDIGDRIAAAARAALRVQKREVRSARRAGIRLRVKAPIERRAVLGEALRALRERRHARHAAVVRELPGDRVARPAVGAVDERVAVAAVARIEQLREAIRTDRAVGTDGRRRASAAAFPDHEAALIGLGHALAERDCVHAGKRGRLG
jgi:hypothetical protein